jgi:opacity protein-like surface antigen
VRLRKRRWNDGDERVSKSARRLLETQRCSEKHKTPSGPWFQSTEYRRERAPGYATNWLYYGKAGGGWVRNGASVTDLTTGASVSNSNTRSGWLLGAGIEYGVTPNWTMKFEYDYLGLSNWTSSSPLFVGDTVTLSRQINTFTVGMNYKF